MHTKVFAHSEQTAKAQKHTKKTLIHIVYVQALGMNVFSNFTEILAILIS